MTELKSCPFCGASVITLSDAGIKCDIWFVQCDMCYATFPHFDSQEEAIENWNRRTEK